MMDLVPILSTIILVATLATLVLAVIAYFLYKSRERRARTAAAQRRDTVMAQPLDTADAHTLVVPQYGEPLPALQAAPAYTPTMAALAAAPMMAVDTNFDGHADTLYAPSATAAAMPVAQSYTAREHPYEPPVVPPPPAAPASSMFYEYTQGNLVPVDRATPVAPTMANLGADPYAAQQAHLDAARAQAERAERGAEQTQDRLDRAQDRLDAQRRRDDGLAWL